jgi:hypothetical protein
MSTRAIRFHGADDSYLYFSVLSFSGTGERYEMNVSKQDGSIKCSCADATCRKKVGDILDRESGVACKHVRRLLGSFERILSEGIEVAISA